MPVFTISAISDDGATVYVSPVTTHEWYHVYARLTSEQYGTVYDNWFRLTQGYYVRLSGLSPGTSYTVNVAYGTGPSADETVAWIGAQTFVTTGTSPGGGGGTTTTYYAYLTFNANGGTGAPGTVYGDSTDPNGYVQMDIPYTEPTRSGYIFAGWATNAAGTGTIRYPGGTYTGYGSTTSPGEGHTLYAVWTKQASTGKVQIGNGYGFNSYTPYIWYNGGWQKAVPYVWYNGGWRKGV